MLKFDSLEMLCSVPLISFQSKFNPLTIKYLTTRDSFECNNVDLSILVSLWCMYTLKNIKDTPEKGEPCTLEIRQIQLE